MIDVEQRIKALGIELFPVTRFDGGMVPVKKEGHLVYTAGVGPFDHKGGLVWVGKVGEELSLEEGYQAARQCAIVVLGALKNFLGDLNKIESIVKVNGFVASGEGFYQQPQVMHGFSDLMVEIFGERGRHARSAIGVYALPGNIPVEVEMIVSLKGD